MQRATNILKRLLLGPVILPQKVDLGLLDPQSEVEVWLDGLGTRIDVTHLHLMSCGAPLTICIAIDGVQAGSEIFRRRLALCFHEHGGRQQLLGEIGLRFASRFQVGTQQLCLFQVTGYRNHCLPLLRTWAHYLLYARAQSRNRDNDVPITTRETRAMIVFYLCPRPVALVTVEDSQGRNMFPMNLMGPLGDGYFAFALNSHRAAAPLVERARRVVLSSIPLKHSTLVSRLGANHRRVSIEWDQLPFATVRPKTIDVPVAGFALKVREMHVEAVRPLGSHTLFVAKTIAEESLGEGPQLFSAHGMYQAWRSQRSRKSESPVFGRVLED
jgi:flavin reductase (DIM6/NTAB) family NADH-FMN oxidoreductase RutF